MSEEQREHISITELGDPRKPHGQAGEEMLNGMNERHYPVTGWALGFFSFGQNDRILDIGCGGGETLRRMAELVPEGTLTGADYSEVSVRMSREHNREAVASGRMQIVEASVSDMPFADNSFDKIITVESFYFWGDPENDLREVYRVLAPGGTFLIVADIHGGAELDEDDLKCIEKYRLFNPTPEQFSVLLENAGFSDVAVHTKEGTKWVCAEGHK